MFDKLNRKVTRFKNTSCEMVHKLWIKKVDGIGVVEIILILAILIALVIIFRDKITEIVSDVLDKITGDVSTI